jgi:hypothetical protein
MAGSENDLGDNMNITESVHAKLAQLQQKEAEITNLNREIKELTGLKKQHSHASVEFQGTKDSQFVTLEGVFTSEALLEIVEIMTHVPMEIRRRWNK